MSTTIYTGYDPAHDITVIYEDTWNGDELVSTEIKGFYYGYESEATTIEFYEKLKAEFDWGDLFMLLKDLFDAGIIGHYTDVKCISKSNKDLLQGIIFYQNVRYNHNELFSLILSAEVLKITPKVYKKFTCDYPYLEIQLNFE